MNIGTWPREGVIIECPLNGQFHDARDVLFRSYSTLHVRHCHTISVIFKRLMFVGVIFSVICDLQIFRSYSFGHVESVKWSTLNYNFMKTKKIYMISLIFFFRKISKSYPCLLLGGSYLRKHSKTIEWMNEWMNESLFSKNILL